jgi:multiple sugar transport system substrate-binding protein
MKKKFLILTSIVVMISLTACNEKTSMNQSEPTSSNAVSTASPSTPTNSPAGKETIIEDENKESKKTIVVSILSATDFYKQAKQRYEAAHPNTKIEFKEFVKAGSGSGVMSASEVEKYIKQSTTEILSGKGADLFAFTSASEGLPIDKYVSKNAFVNVDEFIRQDKSFDQSQYYMNILGNSKMNGGLYVLPTKFYLQALFGDQVAIEKAGVTIDDKKWTWSQFADVSKSLAAKGVHTNSLSGLDPENMLNSLVSDNYARLVDGTNGKANFDSSDFTELLNRVKSLYDDKIIAAKPLAPKDSNFYLSEIYSPNDFISRNSIYYTNGSVYQKPHTAEQQSGVAFGGLQTIAMNANSTIKATAWDFMKFLLSEEMQSLPEQTGFPVKKSANEKLIEEIGNNAKKGTVNTVKGGNVKVSEKDIQVLNTMISEASLQITKSDKIRSIIAEESKAFFTGQKTAEAVAKLIQNRVTTYLNE